MEIYLPIAEVTENVFALIGVGFGIGFLSGLVGVGGGFLLTPALIFLGVPSAVAVASGANHVCGSSISGVLAHWRRGNVDLKMGVALLVGGLAGSSIGIVLFDILKSTGQVDLVISLCYVVLLGGMGSLMMVESVQALRKARRAGGARSRGAIRHFWIHRLPYKVRFRRSRLYISALVPVGVGFGVGLLSALMGVGGGFVMVPAMIYLIGMPTGVVVGTSLFQIIFVTANVTFLHATADPVGGYRSVADPLGGRRGRCPDGRAGRSEGERRTSPLSPGFAGRRHGIQDDGRSVRGSARALQRFRPRGSGRDGAGEAEGRFAMAS